LTLRKDINKNRTKNHRFNPIVAEGGGGPHPFDPQITLRNGIYTMRLPL